MGAALAIARGIAFIAGTDPMQSMMWLASLMFSFKTDPGAVPSFCLGGV